MKHKRKTDVEIRDSNILESRILVILPRPELVLEFFELNLEEPISLAKPVQDFISRDLLHRYNFLELHCFLNSNDDVFEKMSSIYASKDMLIEGISVADYQSVVDSQEILPLTSGILGGNFDIIMESHNVWVFAPDYFPHEDGTVVFDRYFDWLSILSNRFHLKFYPPLSQTMSYNDSCQQNKILLGHMLPKVCFCPQWGNMSWYDFYVKYLPDLQRTCRDVDQMQVAKLPTAMVIKPVRGRKIPSENVYLMLDEKKAKYWATSIDHGNVYDSPAEWLTPIRILLFLHWNLTTGRAFRKRSYVFIFWNSKKVDLEKMYMHERKYSKNGVLEKGPIVSKDIGDPTSAIHRFFTRTVQGFPKKFRNDVISELKGKYPAICPTMVYEITLAYSPIQSDKMDLYVASMNTAYSNDAVLHNLYVYDYVHPFLQCHTSKTNIFLP